MSRTVIAVFEKGLLRPLEPLKLEENQRVTVTLEEASGDPLESWIDHEYHAAVSDSHLGAPSLEEVRRALSFISGSLSEAVRTERDLRG